MAKHLVILESPTKAGTVGKILGSDYNVIACKGHVRDLPETMLGIKIEEDFEPVYVNIRKQTDIINSMRKHAQESDCVFLASDPDREGEAIAWHLAYILEGTGKPLYRVTFNEITEKGVREGMENPRSIDTKLVDAYQARRELDRLVGYKISPLLWKKVKKNLSAGRVQSVATRLICDREEEINQFKPKEYWSLQAVCEGGKEPGKFAASYYGVNGKKTELKSEDDVKTVLSAVEGRNFYVADIKKTEKKQSPFAPFTTSTLQQDSSHKIGFSPAKTMQIAQQLYEGVDLPGMGRTGLVTYIRTDSVRIAAEAQDAAREYVRKNFGDAYLPAKKRVFRNKNKSQDAHEAIRPAHIDIVPAMIKGAVTNDQYRLYKLIYERFIASQMADVVYNVTSVTLDCENQTFRASGSVVKFKGFSALYDGGTPKEQEEGENKNLPELTVGETVKVSEFLPSQHFTQPPARYNEASLVKALEELGIGRPSTYATIVSTIEAREYVRNEKKVLYPTEMGVIVNDIMKKGFPDIVDVQFTAGIEDKLDSVAQGELPWKEIIRGFYGPFAEDLAKAESDIQKVKIEPKMSEEICELCGKPMVYRQSRFGDFLGCSGYPACKNTKPIVEEVGKRCPDCGKMLVYKKSKKGKRFISCSGYPACKFSSPYEPTGQNCPVCGQYLVYKKGRGVKKYIACSNAACGYVPSAKKDGEGKEEA